jgi:CheY-like chemotaxis protein
MSLSLNIQVIPLEDVPSLTSFATKKQKQPLALVVDDERIIADTLSIILAKNGLATMTAYDGESALAMAADNAPDLLLSDVMMGPGIDGTELAMALVEVCPECKVLLFSGHSSTRELLYKASAAGHNFTLLNKPLHPADLLARISNMLELELTAA